MSELVVLLADHRIGVVTLSRGRLTFDYDADWLQNPNAIPLSLSMPLTKARHGDAAIKPFLWGLLPDNEATLAAWGRRFGVSPRNAFALLGHIGEDLQGAVQLVPPEGLEILRKREGVTRLSPEALETAFRALMRDPGATQFSEEGGQFSLAGAQPKKALYRVGDAWYEPRGRTPSTHILKPPIPNLAGQVQNEAFCLRLAGRLGLPTPHIWIEHFGDLPVVVIERYDRVRMKGKTRLALDQRGGEVRRVHQEDCCQALATMPQTKYQAEGGPGIADIMQLLSGSAKPAEDRDRFMRAQAFNFVIGGSDAHAKNYSVLLTRLGRFRLAPLYDLISLLPYLDRRRDGKLAMPIDGQYRFDRIAPRHWERQARAAGYAPDRAMAHIRDCLARLPDEASALAQDFANNGLAGEELDRLVACLIERCDVLRRSYGEEADANPTGSPAVTRRRRS
ncbi:MAG: type II toxin-antitoxin system HipA family toxin [Hyphomicrobiaceae bacterium]